MADRAERLDLIAEIIARDPVPSQDALRERLAERGVDVTQATLSRDLRELGVVKAPDGYRMPDAALNGAAGAHESERDRAIRQFVTSIEPVGQLVVMRTGPGQAQLVAATLDDDPPAHTAGTIAGDDTIFLAARSAAAARMVAERLEHAAGIGGAA